MTAKEQATKYIEQEVSRIYARLNKLEGREDNPAYRQEIKALCQELNSLYADLVEMN